MFRYQVRSASSGGRGPVVDAVVRAARHREARHRALRVVGDIGHVGREERLVPVVDAGGDVRPPQERLGQRRPIDEPHPHLDQRRVGMDRDPVHALHPVHRLVLAAPHRHAAVRVLLDRPVHRRVRRRAMVLRPVELDAAADPRAEEADERRLDDVLAVEEVVAVGAVEAHVDATADLGQHHQPQVPVLEVDGRPGVVDAFVGEAVRERVRVDPAGAALVDPLLEEHRVGVGRRHLVGGDRDGLHPGRDGPFPLGRGPIGQDEAGSESPESVIGRCRTPPPPARRSGRRPRRRAGRASRPRTRSAAVGGWWRPARGSLDRPSARHAASG